VSIKHVNSFQDLVSPRGRKWVRIDTSKSSSHETLSDCAQSYSCRFCDEQFASRNAVFRHLRTNAQCFDRAAATSTAEGHLQRITSLQLPKQKIVIRFGYHVKNIMDDTASGSSSNQNEVAADLVKNSFFEALIAKQPVEPSGSESVTQASIARHRHPCLSQDYDCSSSSDFICINFKGEPVQNMTVLRVEMQQRLDQYLLSTNTHSHTQYLEAIHIIDARELPTSSKFQAEQSCTQRIYHYLLPLDWLVGGEEARDWWLQLRLQESSGQQRDHQLRGAIETPQVLVRLKGALKSFESSTVSEDEQDSKVSSPGRFGSLWTRERRCWHNFADPSLGGKASPSNDPVWRAVDKARLAGVVSHGDQYAAVVEIKGDGFVTQQIRRILGSVVAITNDWLPLEFASVASRSDVCIETPLAPSGRSYLAGARFHFVELAQGSSFFEESSSISQDWQAQLHSRLFQGADRIETRAKEQVWLDGLRDTVVPEIRLQLQNIAREDEVRLRRTMPDASERPLGSGDPPVGDYSETPDLYRQTVTQLRAIVDHEKWPRTSRARSRVIRSIGTGENGMPPRRSGPNPAAFVGELFQSGSFTIINNELIDEKAPLGNELFPDLVKAVFDLEAELARLSPQVAHGTQRLEGARPPSTHCAINRNAEFVPHVDSGTGQGQSVSMIVGLGDFDGGSIFVEGQSYDIRYQPLEFDGWKQRHWTEPFRGERYSLVWFTPAGANVSAGDGKGTSREEKRAERLVSQHQAQLPTFPVLKYRLESTDALVINEILDAEKGCAYELKNHDWVGAPESRHFSPRGHRCVLDIGAHIGVFSRYALSVGCQEVIAYEPEPSNLELLRYNLRPVEEGGSAKQATIRIHDAAVAHGSPGSRQLVHARNRNDGIVNTWRHSLEEYSQYVDKTTKLPSSNQEGTLTRSKVSTVPFFGGALVPGVTFVKLDCEGAEIDIILSDEAAMAASWLEVTHLVFEWSFTKEKRVAVFQQAVSNLKQAGFDTYYEGQGAWWEQNELWPFHTDLVVYAMRI
jgi:FkbM family methyltransferase